MHIPKAVLITVATLSFVATACSDDRVTATEDSGTVAQMVVVSGDQQTAQVGTQLPNPVVVRVVDAGGSPVSGQIVNFRVTQGGGSVFAGASLSDQAGLAQEWWMLGPNAGGNTLEARAVESSTGQKLVFATFHATGQTGGSGASVTVNPSSATLAPGGTQQFAATIRDVNGNAVNGAVTWSSTNANVATVSGQGVAQAIASGSATIRATSGGNTGTAALTVTAASPPPPPPPSGKYQTVAGSDWSYGSKSELRSAGLFWWYLSSDVYNYVDLVPDQTFGQVVRVHFAQSSQTGYAPKITASFAPLDRMWYRFRVKFQPGFTTAGANPAGYANSWKMAFWTWEGYQARGQIEFSNTNEYILGVSVRDAGTGQYVRYNETPLPGSQSWGKVTTEWTDGQWWEYVVYWEKTGASTARQHLWRRRLTNNGVLANNAYTYIGWSFSGATTPRVRAIDLGANKNKSNDRDMYLFWGPWEVVDGSAYANPWGMNLP